MYGVQLQLNLEFSKSPSSELQKPEGFQNWHKNFENLFFIEMKKNDEVSVQVNGFSNLKQKYRKHVNIFVIPEANFLYFFIEHVLKK